MLIPVCGKICCLSPLTTASITRIVMGVYVASTVLKDTRLAERWPQRSERLSDSAGPVCGRVATWALVNLSEASIRCVPAYHVFLALTSCMVACLLSS